MKSTANMKRKTLVNVKGRGYYAGKTNSSRYDYLFTALGAEPNPPDCTENIPNSFFSAGYCRQPGKVNALAPPYWVALMFIPGNIDAQLHGSLSPATSI